MAVPLISVISVTFNALDDLRKTAESVWAQDYKNLEFVVIDGASVDGTAEWLRERSSDSRMLWVSEKDRGIYDAMNKGVRLCHGEWVCFMNAGDSFASPNCLSLIVKELSNPQNDVVYGSVNVIKNFGMITVRPRGLDLLRRKMAFCHQASLSRRSLLIEHPFNLEYPIVADYDFFHWCYTSGKTFCQVNYELANFEAENGTSSKHRLKVLRECGRISGRNKTLGGTLEYIGQSLEVGFNKLYRFVIPSSLIKKIRALNYSRKRPQC